MLKELQQEMQDIGVQADASAEQRARQRRDQLYSALSNNRTRRNQLEKQLTFCEAEMDALQKNCAALNASTSRSANRLSVPRPAGWRCCAW